MSDAERADAQRAALEYAQDAIKDLIADLKKADEATKTMAANNHKLLHALAQRQEECQCVTGTCALCREEAAMLEGMLK